MLSHPDNAHRRKHLALLIDWRLSYERHMNKSGIAILRAFEEKMEGENSPSLRALSLLHRMEGEDTTYHTANPYAQSIKVILSQPLETQIRVDLERLESVRRFPIVSFLPVQNSIKFDGLAAAFSASAQGRDDQAADFVEQNFVSSQPKPPPPRLS